MNRLRNENMCSGGITTRLSLILEKQIYVPKQVGMGEDSVEIRGLSGRGRKLKKINEHESCASSTTVLL